MMAAKDLSQLRHVRRLEERALAKARRQLEAAMSADRRSLRRVLADLGNRLWLIGLAADALPPVVGPEGNATLGLRISVANANQDPVRAWRLARRRSRGSRRA